MTDVMASLDAMLDDWLEGALQELGDEPRDVDHASKLLGAVRGLTKRISEVDGLVARRIAELQQFRDDQREHLVARREFLEGQLQGWALAEWERTGRKTWKLPAGDITVRPRRPRAEVDATAEVDDELLDRVSAYVPGAVKVERSIRVGAVKPVAEPGELIPGYPLSVEDAETYDAHQAVIGDDAVGYVVVPGIVFLVPKDGRPGQKASVKPDEGLW